MNMPDSQESQAPEGETQQEIPLTTPTKKGTGRALSSLKQRNYRLYLFGQMISLPGSTMQNIGQAWLVLVLTHSPWQLGLVGALQALPILLFSIFGGIIADRWPKRRVLLLSQTAAAIQAFLLWALIATGTLQLWQLYILVLLLGFTNSLGRPASRAIIVEMVGHEDLPNAIGLLSTLSTLGRIASPALAGIIIASSGVNSLFLINALSFAPMIAVLVLIRSHEMHIQGHLPGNSSRPQNPWQSLREGLDYIWQMPSVFLLILSVGLVLLFGSNFNVVLPLFATDILHQGARGFGFLSAATGAGALIAALWVAWGNRHSTIRQVLIGMLIFGVLEVAFGISKIYTVSLLLLTGVGFMEETFAMQAMTTLQSVTPGHLNGRVMSIQVIFFDGSLPLGYLLMGWLAGLYGASTALLVGALLSLLVVAASWLWWKQIENREGASDMTGI